MPSKTARKSGIKGPVVKDPFDTNEKKIKELRKQVEAHLFVRPDFIVALLEEYDVVSLQLDGAKHKLDCPAPTEASIKEPTPSEALQADLEPLPVSEEHHTDPILHEVGLIDHGGEAG